MKDMKGMKALWETKDLHAFSFAARRIACKSDQM
jgi:hypothetical protein